MAQNNLLASVQVALQDGNQPEAVREIDRIVDFCITHENGKVFDGWDRGTVQLMVAYHIAKNTLIYIQQDDEIKGVFMWYNCNNDDNWNFVYDWIPDRPDGDSVFLAFLFSESTPFFKELTELFLKTGVNIEGKRLFGIRHRNGFPKKVEYNQKLFKKILSLN